MAEESGNKNDEVISLDGLDQEPAPTSGEAEKAAEAQGTEPQLTPEQLAEEQFQKIKTELDKDLPGNTILEILREEDAEFISALDQLLSQTGEPIPADYNFYGDAIGFMYVLRKMQRLFLNPTGVLRRRLQRHLGEVHARLEELQKKVIAYLLYLKGGGYKDIIAAGKGKAAYAHAATRELFKAVWHTPRTKKFYFLAFLGSLYLSYFFAMSILTQKKLPTVNIEGVTTFEQVADGVYPFADDVTMEQFDNPIRHSDYTVLLGKVVANLRPTENSSGQPMGAFRFHFEASTRETAMELVDREKEFLDLMQRAIEEMTWDELSTVEGKAHLKLVLRKKINEGLNRGRVKKVMIETIILKN